MSYTDIVNEPVEHGHLKVTRFTGVPGNLLGVRLERKNGPTLNLRIGFDAQGRPNVTVTDAGHTQKHRVVASHATHRGLVIEENVLL